MIKIRKLANSFKYARAGLKKVFLEEQNFQVHCLIASFVLIFAAVLQVKIWELIILIIIISLVFILEIANSIFERLLDLIKPRLHSYVRDIKDMTAALVLVSALTAIIVGLIIFLPYLINLIKI